MLGQEKEDTEKNGAPRGETNHEGNRNMGEKVRARKGVLETCPVSENNVRQEKKSTGLIERKNNQHTEYI